MCGGHQMLHAIPIVGRSGLLRVLVEHALGPVVGRTIARSVTRPRNAEPYSTLRCIRPLTSAASLASMAPLPL
jgi:hypothetical protein